MAVQMIGFKAEKYKDYEIIFAAGTRFELYKMYYGGTPLGQFATLEKDEIAYYSCYGDAEQGIAARLRDGALPKSPRETLWKAIEGSCRKRKFQPLAKEFVTLAVKDSVWEFTEDCLIQHIDINNGSYTIPAGTRVTISDKKMRMGYHYPSIKCIVVKEGFLPVRDVAPKMRLVEAGAVKTYWLLLKADGSRAVDKRFASLAQAKSSIRTRTGMVKDDGGEDSAPYWIAGPAEKGFDGFMAVQYDHATDVEIAREDLMPWTVMQKLKHS